MAKKDKDWWVAYRAKKKAEKQAQEMVAQPLFATVCNDLQPATDVASATGKNTTDGATPVASATSKSTTPVASATSKSTTPVASATPVAKPSNQSATSDDTIRESQGCNRNLDDAKEIAKLVRSELGDIIKFPYDDWTKFKDSIIGDPAKLFPIREEVADATRKLEQEMQRLHENQKDLEAQLQVQPEQDSLEQLHEQTLQQLDEVLEQLRDTRRELERKYQEEEKTADHSLPKKIDPIDFIQRYWKLAASLTGIFTLVLGNTVFLTNEQFSFYCALGYSAPWAFLLAVLCEGSLLAFSGIASAVKSWRWKLPMYAASILTAAMILGVLGGGVEHRSAEKVAASDVVKSLKNRQSSLESLRASASADLAALSPEVYPSKRNDLRAKIETWNSEIEKLGAEIAGAIIAVPEKVEQQETILKFQRALMMLWNVLLAGFVGYMIGWAEER